MLIEINSHYTLDGFITFEDAKKVVDHYGDQQPTLLISDANSLSGAPDFVAFCKKNKIDYLVGSKLMLSVDNSDESVRGYITAVARNEKGLTEISRLLSQANTPDLIAPSNHTYKLEDLQGQLENVDILVDENSPAFLALQSGDADKALDIRNKIYMSGAKRVLYKHHAVKDEVISTSKTLSMYNSAISDVDDQFLIDSAEISVLRHEHREVALKRQRKKAASTNDRLFYSNRKIARNIDTEKLTHTPKFNDNPQVSFENELYIPDVGGSHDFTHTAWEKLNELVPEKHPQRAKYEERLKHELGVIDRLGLGRYFKLICGFANFCKEKGVPLNLRGSAASSLVLYLNDVSPKELDPVALGLDVRRFIDDARAGNFADIDIELPSEYSDLFSEYVNTHQLGDDPHHDVCSLMVFEKSKFLKSTLTEAASEIIDSKSIDTFHKKVFESLKEKKIVKGNKDYSELKTSNADLPTLLGDKRFNVDEKKVIFHALTLNGINNAITVHPSKHILTRLGETMIPVFIGANGKLIAAADKDNCESMGFIPYDMIKVNMMSCIHRARNIIEARGLDAVDISDAFLKGEKNKYAALFNGLTESNYLINQISSDYAMKYINAIEPDDVTSFAFALALIRPAAGDQGEIGVPDEVLSSDPVIANVLNKTRGVFTYDEQILQITTEAAGLTNWHGDQLRTAIRKNKPQIIDELREPFINGLVAKGRTIERSEEIFENIANYTGKYFFNESHAMSYTVISLEQMVIKNTYPEVFFESTVLHPDKKSPSPTEYKLEGDIPLTERQQMIAHAIKEYQSNGFSFESADVNISETENFSCVNSSIYPSLASVIPDRGTLDIIDRIKASQGKVESIKQVCDTLNRLGEFDVGRASKVSEQNSRKCAQITDTVVDMIKLGLFDKVPFNEDLAFVNDTDDTVILRSILIKVARDYIEASSLGISNELTVSVQREDLVSAKAIATHELKTLGYSTTREAVVVPKKEYINHYKASLGDKPSPTSPPNKARSVNKGWGHP